MAFQHLEKRFDLNKGFGKVPEGFVFGKSDVKDLGWNLLRDDISFPTAVLDLDKLENNINWMDEFLKNYNGKVVLAPHGKTTMMPAIYKKVLEKPSTWGLTCANATQSRLAHAGGVTKIIMANQLVGKRNMEIISELMEDKELEFMCIVDSAKNVEQLGEFFSEKGQEINVLLEFGPMGGRTGVRNEEQVGEVVDALEKCKHTVKLIGVEFYEGVLRYEEAVGKFADSVLPYVKLLQEDNAFQKKPIILTGAGSAWFDVVCDKLTKFAEDNDEIPLLLIVRPGCYMIHDVGLYAASSRRIKEKGEVNGELKTVFKLWARVQSIPESRLAILGFGRRDSAHDSGFPRPTMFYRPGEFEKPVDIATKTTYYWEIFYMMDQHAYMKIEEGDDIQVGDVVIFDVAHPCTNIDKWRKLLVMNDTYDIVDIYETFF